jgi:hypothetical protein
MNLHALSQRWLSPARFALIGLVLAALLTLTGCAGSSNNEAATTGATTEEVESTTEEETTTEETGPSNEVVAWAKTWRRTVDAPMRKAGAAFVANALAAVEGNSAAGFRVSAQLNRLSNCRIPLDIRLATTPSELSSARRLSLRACRSAYVGVNTFIKGWNQRNLQGYSSEESQARVQAGVALVKKALRLLRKAERAVAKATT